MTRAEHRRHLYATDPLYRLSKLKANWEDREAYRRAGLRNRRVAGGREWRL